MNPLLEFSGLPRFGEIQPAHVAPAVDQLIAENKVLLEQHANATDAPGWDTFVAPLDDANVERYLTLMDNMASKTDTRFLVITHHPQTMARMDRLFGVTMVERGISRLVSVDLEGAEELLAAE